MAIAGFTGCSDDPPSSDGAFPARCGLLTPEPDLDAAGVPTPFVLDGVEVVKVHKSKDRLTIALNYGHSVADSFAAYKKAAVEAGFELVGQDNEGFEAEIYLKRDAELGAIQIRTSRCRDASVVFVNIVRT